jgi:hypothetical protein
MATTEADTKSVIESGSLPDTDGERDLRRRVNLEANLTAACGYGKKKQELVDSFWSIVWTGLAEQGWTKVRRITTFSPFHSPNFHQSIIGLMLMLIYFVAVFKKTRKTALPTIHHCLQCLRALARYSGAS